MGNRVSIWFKNRYGESPILFSHWDGLEFVGRAKRYIETLKQEIKDHKQSHQPLGRLEPGTVMVDFIRHITMDIDRTWSNICLAKSVGEGDNSDNGHHTIYL